MSYLTRFLPSARILGATTFSFLVFASLAVFLASILAMSPAPARAADRIKVVASIPDLGDMARRVGGERVDVTVLASGREDLHGVPARPSFIPKINRADLLVTLGLDAEHSWLPALAQEARNRKVMEDQEGWIEVFEGVEILDIPAVISRSEGEQHPEGNPHINVGPQNGRIMAENVAYALMDTDPAGAADYETNLETYAAELDALVERLGREGAALDGVTIVSYHADVAYLARFYGLERVGTLEPKPGIEPTARHLAELAKRAKAMGVKLVIYHQAQCGKLPEKFAARIGAVPVQFANSVGAKDGIETWAQLQEYNLRALLEGLERAGATGK